ncbi:MAG: bifunctional riboflavin kinase/FAD synthetase [Verrucomicrobiota bacterium]
MKTFDHIEGLKALPAPHHLAIGVFDGVHLGHKAVIGEALRRAEKDGGSAIVVTFDPHPSRVLFPDSPRRLLASTEHKKLLIGSMGVDGLLVIHFDRPFSEKSARQFVEDLVQESGGLKTICVGKDWKFGARREGDVRLLELLAKDAEYSVVAVDAVVSRDGEVVSSTRIRVAVQNGDFATAEFLLGRDYTVLGRVIEGDRLGGKIGYPTANLTVFNEELPPNGVYAVEATLDGRVLTGVGNLGVRPTINQTDASRRLEIHFFDFAEDIYGRLLEVHFRGFIRPERKFDGIDSLKAQIAEDAEKARELLMT